MVGQPGERQKAGVTWPPAVFGSQRKPLCDQAFTVARRGSRECWAVNWKTTPSSLTVLRVSRGATVAPVTVLRAPQAAGV